MKKKLIVMMLLLAFVVTGCSKAAPKEEVKKEEAATESSVTVKEMKGEDLQKLEDDKKLKDGVVVVDVRGADEYRAGHLQHAVNISLEDLKADTSILEEFKDKPIILYCNTGNRSGQAAELLVENGFTDVTNAQGVKEFKYNLFTYSNALPKQFKEAVASGEAVIVDARDAKDYDEGHLKGALNIQVDNLDASLDQLPKDKTIYAYCYSGNKSGQIAQKLTELGYENVYNVLEGTKEYEYELVK